MKEIGIGLIKDGKFTSVLVIDERAEQLAKDLSEHGAGDIVKVEITLLEKE